MRLRGLVAVLLLSGCASVKTLNHRDFSGARSLRGHVVLINAFRIDCPVCEAELVELRKVYDKYKDRGLEIVGFTDCRPPGEQTTDMPGCLKITQRYPWATIQLAAGTAFLAELDLTWVYNRINDFDWPNFVPPGHTSETSVKTVILGRDGKVADFVETPGHFADFDAKLQKLF